MASCHPSYSSLSSSSSSIPKRSHFPSFPGRKPSGGSRSATGTGSMNAPPPRSNTKLTSGIAVAASPNALDPHYSNDTDHPTSTNASNSTIQQSGTSAGSGIPSLRSLRSLLPFSNAFKQNPPQSQTAHEHSTPSKGPFAGFGSMRKSMNLNRDKEKEPRRERKMSLASDLPFITIERKPLARADDVDGPLRRSMSLPGMEALDLEKPLPAISSPSFVGNTDHDYGLRADRLLRTPSPGPPLLADHELSTIIEADSSGISKHIPLRSPLTDSSSSLPTSPHRVTEEDTIRLPVSLHPPVAPLVTSSPPGTPVTNNTSPALPSPADNVASAAEAEIDSDLELSMSQLVSQVQDAMARTSWSGSDGPVMIDGEESFSQQDYQDHLSNEEDEIDFSLLVQAGSASPSPSPSPCMPSFPAEPSGDDDTSRINNSLSSVVNPNELCFSSAIRGEQNMTLDLGSLDPDLRDAVTRHTHHSPISPVNSSTSGHTVTLSSSQRIHSSPIPRQQTSTSARSASGGSVPSTSAKYGPLGSSIPLPKRRVVSSLIPRVQSPSLSKAVHSAPTSAKNSSSPRKMTLGRVQNTETPSGPQPPVFVAAHITRSLAGANAPVEKVAGVLTSTPARVKPKKTVIQRGHSRVSSVPNMSRRSLQRSFEDVETEEIVGPEVKIIEASGELGHNEQQEWSDDTDQLDVERRPLQNGLHPTSHPIVKLEPDEDADTRILGSPFQTSSERNRPGHGPSHSHSYSPSPSPTLPPSSTLRRTTTPNPKDHPSIGDGSSSTPAGFIAGSDSSLYPPPRSLVPIPSLPQNGFSENPSSREGSPSKLADAGSSNDRVTRRNQALPRLFWGNNESNRGSEEETRDLVISPDRQPSPLRSVFRAEKYGDDEDRSGRRSIDDSTTIRSFRPSLDSGRPSLESHPGSSSASRRSPEPRYYGSTEPSTSRPPTRLRDREGLIGRIRKRSVGAPEYPGEEDPPQDLLSPGPYAGNLSSAAISARERLARARYGDLGGGSRPLSSMSLRSGRPESLLGGGGRRGAGGSVYVGERDRSPGRIERSTSERMGERERDITMYRDRSGSVSALGGANSGGIGTLGRYASLRSASEYNFGATGSSTVDLTSQRQHPTRAYSRMAYSESGSGGGHGRRDSVTYSTVGQGLMESPISTVSTSVSGSAARSSSTGATSVSQFPLGSTREREELRELKEKHAVETGALLGALSDSQRTCRVLREENGELRERMTELERENERLKVMVSESEQEVERLKILQERERERGWLREREHAERGGGLSMSIGNGTITSWRNSATPIAKRDIILGPRAFVRQPELNGFSAADQSQLTKRHSKSKLDNVLFSHGIEQDFSSEPESSPELEFENQDQFSNRLQEEAPIMADQEDAPDDVLVLPPTISSTLSQSMVHKRRPSTSSSIFPVPPPNMTMLLDDESALFQLSSSRRNSAEIGSLHSFKLPASVPGSSILPIHPSRREGLHTTSNSLSTSLRSSNMSISPTENLSMITSGTGSPGSLFLKPEHEMMLDEMESLDLNRHREELEENELWN